MTLSVTYVEIDVPSFVVQSPETTQTFRFAIATSYLPPEIECIPSLQTVSFTPARISLGENLGERASVSAVFGDHRHIFAGENYDQGTFWGKWRGRYGTKLRGRAFRLIRGTVGQTISQMETRHYVIEATSGPTANGTYTIEAKDLLKYADEDRAQAPRISNGSLAGSLTAIAATAILSPTGIGDSEYPTSGYACFGGSEVCAFTRVSDTLTISRGEFGSVAQAHEAGDRVQIVLRYAGTDAADIIYDLLVNYAGVSTDYISLTDWQAETAAYLGVIYAATITEPTSVRKLISELIEQAALAIWWDDRARLVRLAVLREISTDTDVFDEERIIEGSFSVQEQPSKRISQIWTFYGQRDPTQRNAGEDNYRAGLADTDLAREGEYGGAAVKKITARWIETLTAATRLNSLQISRFRDPPRAFTFELTRSENISLATGYQLRWWGSQDSTGELVNVPIQVTQIAIDADRIRVEAEEMLASGVVVIQNVIILTTAGVLSSLAKPSGWNDANNTIEFIGGGGGGRAHGSGAGGRGGGAGAYSKIANFAYGASEQYYIGEKGLGGSAPGISGTDGGDSYFGGATLATSDVGAKGGLGGTSRTDGGTGGQAAAGVGTTKYSGGDGGEGAPQGTTRAGGGGGGGAGGPHGNGASAASYSAYDTTQDAGSGGGGADGGYPGELGSGQRGGDGGDNRFSFGGGNSTTPSGDEGGGGRAGDSSSASDPVAAGQGGNGEQLWTQTISPIISAGPGGGGGGGGSSGIAGDGGLYGGGGGGSHQAAAGDGAQGVGVLTWIEA